MNIPKDVSIAHYELILNEDCNLRCKYCFDDTFSERKASPSYNSKLSIDRIDSMVEFIKQTRDENRITEISFFGGEPLTNWPFIEKWLSKRDELGFVTSYGMTTNGTLLDKEKINTLAQHNVGISISVDGFRDSHDAKRIFANGKGSYDKIMKIIPFLFAKYNSINKPITFFMVINDETYDKFYDNYKVLTRIAGLDKVSVLYAYEELTDEMIKSIDDQMTRLFIEEGAMLPPSISKFLNILNHKSQHVHGCNIDSRFCHSPKKTVTITPKGDLFYCHRSVPKLYDTSNGFDQFYGNIEEGWINEDYFNRKWSLTTAPDNLQYLKECNNCECYDWCSGGCSAAHFQGTGMNDDTALLDSFCSIQKILNKIIVARK